MSGPTQNSRESPLHKMEKKMFLFLLCLKLIFYLKDEYFFSLDLKAGKLLCYKEIDSKKKSTWLSLLKAKMIGILWNFRFNFRVFLVKEEEDVIYIKTAKKKNILIIPLQKTNFPHLKFYLETCFRVQKKSKTKMFLAYLGKGAYKILKLPFRMTSGLIFSLEKVH